MWRTGLNRFGSGQGLVADAFKCGNEPSGTIKYREFFTRWRPVSFAGKNLLHEVCVSTYFGSFPFPSLQPVCLRLISNPQFALSTVTSYVNLQRSVPQNVRVTNPLHIYNTKRGSDAVNVGSIVLVYPSLQQQVKHLDILTTQLFVEVTRTIWLEREIGCA
jgi:hypothetical protein